MATKTLKQNVNKVRKNPDGTILLDPNDKPVIEFTFPVGTQVNVSFTGERPTTMILEQGGQTVRCRPAKYVYYFGGKAPSAMTMMKWDEDGYCKTVTGYKTESDGYGPDGSPSWMLALGLI